MSTDKKIKHYVKDGIWLTERQYNRYAQQAHRKGISTEEYLAGMGWIKTWGQKKGA